MEPSMADALTSARGQEVLRQVAEALGDLPADGAAAVRLGTELRRHHPAELVAAALTQHELRDRAVAKFSRASRMLFTRDGLEQASAEPVARHRAARLAAAVPAEALVADLCTGIGGDLIALAAGHRPPGGVLAVDTDPVHLRLAGHNAQVYGVAEAVAARHADARTVDLAGVAAAFVDPARRAGGRRSPPGRSEPPLEWCVGLARRVPLIGVKTAPGLPHQAVPGGWELELIARGRDLKEAVLWSPPLATVPRRATVLPAAAPGAPDVLAAPHTLLPAPGPPVPVAAPGRYVLDPNPAVTRAGLVEDLARAVGAWKLDDRLAFLSADAEPRTPFARTLRVLDSLPWHERRIRERLATLDAGSVDIRRRGLPGDVDRIRRGLRTTGSRRVTLLMTRAGGRPWCVIAEDPPATDSPG
jgi:hypothetical protein